MTVVSFGAALHLDHPLYPLVLTAHAASAQRENLSSVTLLRTFEGSGSYIQALMGALATLGFRHGPITATAYLLLDADYMRRVDAMLDAGVAVPGFGSSFPLPDPVWGPVEECLRAMTEAKDAIVRLDDITNRLSDRGALPNPSAWTALSAIALGLTPELAPYLLVAGRLRSWTELLLPQFGGKAVE